MSILPGMNNLLPKEKAKTLLKRVEGEFTEEGIEWLACLSAVAGEYPEMAHIFHRVEKLKRAGYGKQAIEGYRGYLNKK